ncbi:hypothetical protein Bca52824_032160 [Brassica carinata]|uniref:RRM domain-containing protein n=1 Tax=Brassica carinata TaxID=52824 RepID=A0A8X7V5X9_BRACI|nr:hypothetical protein Bca52824_032160 [Brassica carinata]
MATSASSLALSTSNPKSLPFSISRPATASLLPPSISFKLHSESPSLSISASSSATSRFVRSVAVTDDFSVEEDGSIFANDDAPPPPLRKEQSFSSDLKLFVGNLPFNVDSAQLAQIFESSGNVEMVEVMSQIELMAFAQMPSFVS